MTDCRLIIDPPSAGPWNMAVDEWLWDWAGRTGQWCLRFYRWDQPTLSLGYFQNHDDRRQHPSSASCPAVRRISGGGAIVHDVEWTYSLAVPLTRPVGRPPGPSLDEGHVPTRTARGGWNMPHQWLYEVVHGAIVEVLADFGVPAKVHRREQEAPMSPLPFLCFERRSPGDVLVGSIKVAGSAQRRSARALLQHGSLLLARSLAAPELPGLKELTGREFRFESVLEAWLARLSDRLRLAWTGSPLAQSERESISQFVAEKHARLDWVRSRTRSAFSASSQ